MNILQVIIIVIAVLWVIETLLIRDRVKGKGFHVEVLRIVITLLFWFLTVILFITVPAMYLTMSM